MSKKNRFKRKHILSIVVGLSFVGVILFVSFRERHFSPNFDIIELKKINTINGIDISRYQAHINWEKVAPQIDFVFIRATSGKRYVDPLFEEHYSNAKDKNVPIGVYHYFIFHQNGLEQAQHFLQTLGNNEFELPLVVDVEEHPTYGPASFNQKKTVENLKSFIETVEKATKEKMIIYTNIECFDKYIKRNFPTQHLWICTFKGKQSLPSKWLFWQTTHTGKIRGIKGHVDINVFNGNRKAWESFIGLKI